MRAFVYLAQVLPDGAVKIGFTRAAPQHRMRSLSFDGQRPALCAAKPFADSQQACRYERELHRRLAPLALCSEWYPPTADIAAIAVDLGGELGRPMAGVEAPLSDATLRLRAWVAADGRSLRAIARALEIDIGTLLRWLSGERRPKLDGAIKLQRVTGVPVLTWVREAA